MECEIGLDDFKGEVFVIDNGITLPLVIGTP
jgi:hypothetical protein